MSQEAPTNQTSTESENKQPNVQEPIGQQDSDKQATKSADDRKILTSKQVQRELENEMRSEQKQLSEFNNVSQNQSQSEDGTDRADKEENQTQCFESYQIEDKSEPQELNSQIAAQTAEEERLSLEMAKKLQQEEERNQFKYFTTVKNESEIKNEGEGFEPKEQLEAKESESNNGKGVPAQIDANGGLEGSTSAQQKLTAESHQQKTASQKPVGSGSYSEYQNQLQGKSSTKQIEKEAEEYAEADKEKAKKSKKKKKKAKNDDAEPLPIISAQQSKANTQPQIEKVEQQEKISPRQSGDKDTVEQNQSKNQQEVSQSLDEKPEPNGGKDSNHNEIPQKGEPEEARESVEAVSEIIDPNSAAASIILLQANRQRIGSTLDYFTKYLVKHQKHSLNQKALIKNIQEEIEKKRQEKQQLFNAMKDYLGHYASMTKDFYEKSYKFSKHDKQMPTNPMINMKEELKKGFQELIFLRKSTGNDFNRIYEFIDGVIQKEVRKTFEEYWNNVVSAQNQQKDRHHSFLKKQKELVKRIAKVEKVYFKGKEGVHQEEDLFVEMAKFISLQKEYRNLLIEYGLGLVPLKKAFLRAEELLYEDLQLVLNNFKNQVKNIYGLGRRDFTQVERFQKLVKERNSFERLADITDADYVRSVLLVAEKSTLKELTDKDFEKVLNMLHFEHVVGYSYTLLKGTTSKVFDLKKKGEQLVDTISGNLVLFDEENAQMKDKYAIRNMNAKIVGEGVIQIDEVMKGFIFDSNRTVRITFRDNDRAEELICFLNTVQEGMELNKIK